MRFAKTRLLKTFLSLAIISITCADTFSQDKHKGIALYEEGKYKEAATVLSSAVKSQPMKNDPAFWNYLGLSYHQTNEIKKAVKSFERAVKLNPGSSTYRTNVAYTYLLNRQTNKARAATSTAIKLDPNNVTAYHLRGTLSYWDDKLEESEADALYAIKLDPNFAPAYRLQSDIIIAHLRRKTHEGGTIRQNISLLEQAVNTLELGVKNSIGQSGHQQLAEHLESIRVFYQVFAKPVPSSLEGQNEPKPGVTPYRILSKPKPVYTNRARSAGTQGVVRIVLVLGADGNVGPMLVLKQLPNGLTEQAVAAAKQIKFEPKAVDGKPVSVVVTLEYGFNIY